MVTIRAEVADDLAAQLAEYQRTLQDLTGAARDAATGGTLEAEEN